LHKLPISREFKEKIARKIAYNRLRVEPLVRGGGLLDLPASSEESVASEHRMRLPVEEHKKAPSV
jgi:hypothetical protein